MNHSKGPLIINLKNYRETSGINAVQIAKEAEKVAKELGLRIWISPPQVLLGLVCKSTSLGVIGQHVDLEQVGASTGYSLPEMIKDVGGIGSIINHSEHSIDMKTIKGLIDRMRTLELTSIVCAGNLEELKLIGAMEPDFVAIEPPEFIWDQEINFI